MIARHTTKGKGRICSELFSCYIHHQRIYVTMEWGLLETNLILRTFSNAKIRTFGGGGGDISRKSISKKETL